MLGRVSGLPTASRNSTGTSGFVSEGPAVGEGSSFSSNWKKLQDGTNITPKQQHGPTTRRDTPKSAWEDCEMATKKTEQLYKVSSPCLDDHHIKEFDAVGELFEVFSQSVLKCFTWHELVGQSEQSFKIRNKIDTSLWQTIGKTNVIHSSDKELPSL